MSSSEKKPVEIEDHEHQEVEDKIPAELEELLHTDHTTGLTTDEAMRRLEQFGRNELPEKKTNPFLKFLSYFTGSIAFLIEVACILSAVVKDWINFGIILGLLFINAIIGFVEEARAEGALDALKNTLALKSRVWRDGKLVEIDSAELVPGDIIILRLGDIVPADTRLLGIGATGEATEHDLSIDQSALTGESLPQTKGKGKIAYSSSIVKQGQMLGVVVKTGVHTYIGRAANLISITNEQGHFQKIVNTIGNFLVVVTVIMVIIIFIYLTVFYYKDPVAAKTLEDAKKPKVLEALRKVLVITVAAIPVGLPTVLSVTMAVGAGQLAKKQVIVKRLTAVEEMASISILCSDKTGTLTLNELTFDDPWLTEGFTKEDILLYSYLAAEQGANDPIESAVRFAAKRDVPIIRDAEDHRIPGYKVTSFLPFNPTSKLTQATITNTNDGDVFKVAKGAPQVIIRLCGGSDDAVRAVNSLARRGLRALGVAKTTDPAFEKWELIGMISLLDPPRPDSAETIARCQDMGVTVKMITGDQLVIAKEVCARLGMERAILDANKLIDENVSEEEIARRCEHADGFAQVIPEHKYRVVELLQNKGLLVGMTGDGVNDAPALKKANVGIAVHGCTDAARSAADIVLLAPGLSTIVDGIVTSRAIFQRMRSYALYRITSTIHFLIFFFIVTMAFKWQMRPILLIFIAVLNDAATLVISVDNAQISRRPDKWRIGQLITLSFILAICITIMSFAHFFIARDVFNFPMNIYADENDDNVDRRLETVMYLHISSCPHFVIFSTRLSGFFWENLPSWTFTIAILGTQIFAMFISIYHVPKITYAIGWGWGVSIIAVSLAYFMVLDVVKVFVIRSWSFEMTAKLWPSKARKDKLAKRRADAIVNARIHTNLEKVKKVSRALFAAALLERAAGQATEH